ncbi:inward rectifier potassium channel [Holotrichia oblita]|uniref:Inward rectifier potassium channel n=1 Tax=Holotrichia oblita TaxID=644536 RepID=A0ACB9TKP0_HOLOL|nr:inward rectifier potassium channel [Holotrichia oblita]
MDLPDTNILVYNDSDYQDSPARESDVEEIDEDDDKSSTEGFQEFINKIRLYNREGPHFIYGQSSEDHKKIKEPRRLIRKSGKYNVSRHEKTQIWDKYLRDFCNTLVHSRWRWTVIAASSSFILTWLLFAVIWMLVANANGDAELTNDRLKCIIGVQGFAGYFMLSLESQVSIGYGSRSLNDHCPEVVFVLCLQIILGVAIGGLTVNIVYIKMTKSQNKYSKLFSKHAVICRRDGDLSLMFRVRDEDSRHAIGTSITAYVLRKDKETGEPYLENIPLEPYGFLIWPLEIVHKITATSPLWDVSSYNLLSDKFEVIVTLQGTSPTTALCSRTRTSYTSSEILWGHKFKNCVKFVKNEGSYVVNHKNFNLSEEYSTHLCSAKRFAEVYSSLSPTPVSRNYRFKVNIMYNTNQRRGTLMSIETMEGGSKTDEQSTKSSQSRDDTDKIDQEKAKETVLEEIKNRIPLERPSTLSLPPTCTKSTSQNYNINMSKPEIITEHYPNYSEKDWEYLNYLENQLPDFWLKEAASLPLINNYNQDQTVTARKFGSDLQNLRVHRSVKNSNGSRNLKNSHRGFEGEEFIFENNISADESNMSLFSTDYTRSDMSITHDPELDAMLKSMESYLEQNSIDSRSMTSSPFPKT